MFYYFYSNKNTVTIHSNLHFDLKEQLITSLLLVSKTYQIDIRSPFSPNRLFAMDIHTSDFSNCLNKYLDSIYTKDEELNEIIDDFHWSKKLDSKVETLVVSMNITNLTLIKLYL